MLARFAPPLARSHPGFYRVVMASIWLHLLLGVDAIVVRPSLPFFVTMREIAPLPVWGSFHIACAVASAVGLYWRFGLVRASMWGSLSTFGVTTGAVVLAVVQGRSSLTLLGFTTFALFVVGAAAIEPPHVARVED